MGSSPSKEEEEHNKNLEEYVRNQQHQVNQYYSQNQSDHLQHPSVQEPEFMTRQSNNINEPKVNITKTVAIKNEFFMVKTSLKLVQFQQQGICSLVFHYTCEIPITIRIYFFAQEVVTENNINQSIQMKSSFNPQQSLVEPTKDSEFQMGLFNIDFNKIRAADLLKDETKQNIFPLIISFEPQNQNQENKKHFYYIGFKQEQGHQYPTPQCLRIKIEQLGQAYITSDVYGLNDASGKECSVCLTELINTIILPCNHMCLCQSCCNGMKRTMQKCPICRGVISSFMVMESTPLPQQQQNTEQNPQQNTEQQAQYPQQNSSQNPQQNTQLNTQQNNQPQQQYYGGQGYQIGGN